MTTRRATPGMTSSHYAREYRRLLRDSPASGMSPQDAAYAASLRVAELKARSHERKTPSNNTTQHPKVSTNQ